GTYLEIGQIFYLYRPRIIPENNDVQGVFWIFRSNKLTKRHRHLFGGCDTVFPIQDHRVRNIDHQYGRGLRFEIRLADLQVVLLHVESVNAVVDLGVADGFGEIDLFQLVAEAERAGLGIDLITTPRFEGIVVALFGLFELPKDL